MIQLFDYNMEAYNSAINMLETKKKAAIIHPTGTGKSFIGFKLCEEHSDKRICWLSPSEYIYKTQVESVRETGGNVPQNITFYTYSKLLSLDEAELLEINPDYIILDEFHRCGARIWGKSVEQLLALYKEAAVLGLSATHIRYLDNQRDMAEELFEGNIASEMSLGEAIVRGILPAPKYITTFYSYQEALVKYEQRVQRTKNRAVRDEGEKYIEILRRSLENAEGLDVIFKRHMEDSSGKYLVFCANKEHMDEMIQNSKLWFGNIDKEPHIYSVYSDDVESEQSFQLFKKDSSAHLKLLFCIDMLNEGVHVDGVTGVILFRPTISPIVYKQQIGRALSVADGTTPVIFDIVNNIENLHTIDALEDEMAQSIIFYRENQKMEEVIAEKFTIYEELSDCRALFQKLNDTLSASWEMMYILATEYFVKYGNLDIPKRYTTKEGYSLGSWIFIQRRVRAGEIVGNLDEDKIRKLDAIKMNWDSYLDANFKKYYECAQEYYRQNKNLDIPSDYISIDGLKLGAWIAGMRKRHAIGSLPEEQYCKLESLGMIWNKYSHLWDQGYQAACMYHAANGTLEVSSIYIDANGYKLGAWLNAQKRQKKDGKLESYQIERLEKLGIQWHSKYDAKWNASYEEAKRYYETNGNLDVPINYRTETGFKLGEWIANNRKSTGVKVTEDRRQKLDAIGMIWTKRDSWDERYQVARKYYQVHGHLRAPSQQKIEGIWLNKWLNEQKQIYCGNRNGKTLTWEQVEKLRELEVSWCVVMPKRCSDEYSFEVGV